FNRVIASSRQIEQDALSFLAVRVKCNSDGFLVFNPCGWTRTDLVETPEPVAAESIAVSTHDSEPVQLTVDGKSAFLVKDIPPYSYRVYRFQQTKIEAKPGASISTDGTALENADYKVVLDPAHGVVTSIFDKHNNREALAAGGSGNRLEIHW